MANSGQIALKPGLAEWKPGAQDSAEVIDTKVKLWKNALGKPVQSAGISGESQRQLLRSRRQHDNPVPRRLTGDGS
jgi:hypothetical protein